MTSINTKTHLDNSDNNNNNKFKKLSHSTIFVLWDLNYEEWQCHWRKQKKSFHFYFEIFGIFFTFIFFYTLRFVHSFHFAHSDLESHKPLLLKHMGAMNEYEFSWTCFYMCRMWQYEFDTEKFVFVNKYKICKPAFEEEEKTNANESNGIYFYRLIDGSFYHSFRFVKSMMMRMMDSNCGLNFTIISLFS